MDEEADLKSKEFENEKAESGMVAPLNEAQDLNIEENVEAEDEQGEMVYGVPEARVPKLLKDPQLPHPSEVAEHNVTHCPYRSWCPTCVEAAGREDAHRHRDRRN